MSQQLVIVIEDGNGLGIVDILHHDITLVAVDDALPVRTGINAVGQNGHSAILIENSDRFHAVHAGFSHTNGRLHPFHIPAEVHDGKVNAVNANIQQSATGQIRIQNTGLIVDLIGQVRGQCVDGTNDAAFDNIIDHLAGRHVAGPNGFGNVDALLPGRVTDDFSLLDIHGECFLADDMLAILDAHHHLLEMVGMRGSDVHEIQIGILEHLFITAECLLNAILFRILASPAIITGRNGIAMNFRDSLQGMDNRINDSAGADNTNVHKILLYFSIRYALTISP